jgi:hypothetical protein
MSAFGLANECRECLPLGAKLPSSNHTSPLVRMNASFAVVLTVMGTALGFMAGGLIGGFPDIIKFITFIIQYFIS